MRLVRSRKSTRKRDSKKDVNITGATTTFVHIVSFSASSLGGDTGGDGIGVIGRSSNASCFFFGCLRRVLGGDGGGLGGRVST